MHDRPIPQQAATLAIFLQRHADAWDADSECPHGHLAGDRNISCSCWELDVKESTAIRYQLERLEARLDERDAEIAEREARALKRHSTQLAAIRALAETVAAVDRNLGVVTRLALDAKANGAKG